MTITTVTSRELDQEVARAKRAARSGPVFIYGSDACRSLSIVGYRVNVELVERVRTGDRDPDHRESDRQSRNALAAHGYRLVWTYNQCDPDDACLHFGDRVRESDITAMRSRDGVIVTSFVRDVRDEARRRGITLTT